MHKLIIDGYNLIYSMPGLNKNRKRKLESARDALLRKIGDFAQRRRTNVTVVFDGQQDEIMPVEASVNKWVQVRFSPWHKKADIIIVELAQLESNPKAVTVVTSDRAIIREIIHAGLKTMKSEEFAHLLEPKRRPQDEEEEGPKPEMSPTDLEVWRRVFKKK